jgi:hypothetical protein
MFVTDKNSLYVLAGWLRIAYDCHALLTAKPGGPLHQAAAAAAACSVSYTLSGYSQLLQSDIDRQMLQAIFKGLAMAVLCLHDARWTCASENASHCIIC